MQTFWITFYIIAGVAAVVGAILYIGSQLKQTFLQPSVDGTVVFAEKYRLVRNSGMAFANRAHIVLSETSLTISIYRALYNYQRRADAISCFTYPLSSVTDIAIVDDPKFNVRANITLPKGPICWSLSLADPSNFIRVATHYQDFQKANP